MPWKECHIMDERVRFVARLLEGEKMAPLCAEFGISRKTGYKLYDRYKDCGAQGLTDRSRRPFRQANQLPFAIEETSWVSMCRLAAPASFALCETAHSQITAVATVRGCLSIRNFPLATLQIRSAVLYSETRIAAQVAAR